MDQKKVTIIISKINRAIAFEWIATHIDRKKIELSFILLNNGDSELEGFIKKSGLIVHRVLFRGKKDIPRAVFEVLMRLKKLKPDMIHAHLFEAGLIGLTAAMIAGIGKRIYTRHHSSFHHVYHQQAVKYDRLCNMMATDIVAISDNVSKILIDKENVNPSKVRIVHHGFDLSEFDHVSEERADKIRNKYNPKKKSPVIGVISRYIEWKGIQFIVPAFMKLLEKYPDALLVLANASGDYKVEIQKLLATLPSESFTEIKFESDLFALYKLFDVFVHAPVDSQSEAFGQVYVEALAAGVPSAFTLSGVAPEFISDKKNAIVLPFKNSEAIYNAMVELLTDRKLTAELEVRGKEDVKKMFALDKMIKSLENLYSAS